MAMISSPATWSETYGRDPACRADHPISDAIDTVMGRPFRRWPLDRLGGDDRTAFDNQGFAG
ncbi:MAG: hypothetical protein WA728_01735, partial [Xanthobacteraceae bacterium]